VEDREVNKRGKNGDKSGRLTDQFDRCFGKGNSAQVLVKNANEIGNIKI
jgi:hypothetical protein